MKKLLDTIKKNTSVKNYRIHKSESMNVSLGVNGENLGGPYTPIESSNSINGTIQIEWMNGEVSFANLTSSILENPKYSIQKMKLTSIKDKYAQKFVNPFTISNPSIQHSTDVSDVILKNQNYIVDQVKKVFDIENTLGIRRHEFGILASQSDVQLVNSKGLELYDRFTDYNISSTWDMKLAFSISSRKLLNIENFKKDLAFLSKIFKASCRSIKINKFKTKNIKVILFPDSTIEFLSFFIASNLTGSLVANDMSRFSKKDFISNKKVFADWFTLKVDPLSKMTPGANNFTSEGIKSKLTKFIDKGKLITPVVDLKHSQKLKMEPTSMFGSPYTTSFVETNQKIQDLEKQISHTKEALLVLYFLGVHTQNQITGEYSLPSPYSIYIKDGKMIGTLKTIVTGNIFDQLREKMGFVKTNLFPLPGICYTPNVIIE
ncbi:metallopeptidase TldD-related protein [Patescibacteria group bacterium]